MGQEICQIWPHRGPVVREVFWSVRDKEPMTNEVHCPAKGGTLGVKDTRIQGFE